MKTGRRSRVPQETNRAKKADQYRAKWDGWSAKAKPIAQRGPAPPAGPDIARGLEYLRDLTGDPVFDDGLRALHSYGLDKELKRNSKRVAEDTFGDPLAGYSVQIDYLVSRKRMSVRAAAEQVAAEFKVPGQSFETVVDYLRRGYRNRQKTKTANPAGDLGYWIEVTPISPGTTDADGTVLWGCVCTRYTQWWRRHWRDGDIAIRRLALG